MSADTASGPRIVALLALADGEPEAGDLEPYLTDPDAAVRRTALDVVTETVPPGGELLLATALGDPDPGVRAAAYDGLREMREVVAADADFGTALRHHRADPEATTRSAVLRLLWEHRIGELDEYVAALADDDEPIVRREAVAGLVSLDAVRALASATGDADPLVRLAVARGLAAVGDPAGVAALDELATDSDGRVRAAALETYAVLGCPPSSLPVVAKATVAEAWEVRKGAALALAAAPVREAVAALLPLARDPHMDVRRAAVQSMGRWSSTHDEVADVLRAATADPDADVRGYARLALG